MTTATDLLESLTEPVCECVHKHAQEPIVCVHEQAEGPDGSQPGDSARRTARPTRQRTWSAGEVDSALRGYFTADLMEQNSVVSEIAQAIRECKVQFPEFSPPRYPSKVTPTRQADSYGCPSTCWPARLASLLHRLPWQGMLTVKTDSPKAFREQYPGWSDLFGPGRWWDVQYPLSPWRNPFWLITFVDGPSGRIDHAHILLGGVSESSLALAVKGWPYPRMMDYTKVSMAKGGPWGLLHYMLSQQGRQPHVHIGQRVVRAPLRRPDSYPERWEVLSPDAPRLHVRRTPTMPSDWEDYHSALADERTPDDWAHVAHWGDSRSYCHNISRPPVESPNLELLRLLHLMRPHKRVAKTKRQRRARKGGFTKAYNQKLRIYLYVRLLLLSPLLLWLLTTHKRRT